MATKCVASLAMPVMSTPPIRAFRTAVTPSWREDYTGAPMGSQALCAADRYIKPITRHVFVPPKPNEFFRSSPVLAWRWASGT